MRIKMIVYLEISFVTELDFILKSKFFLYILVYKCFV